MVLNNEIKEFVNSQKLGFIATVCPDGTPNLSPKGTTRVWDNDHLVFADIHSPGTIGNLLANPCIEINVVDVFTRKGFRFKGVASVFSEGPIFDDVVLHYRNAGSLHLIKNIVMVKVQRVLPVLSPAYDMKVTEEEIKGKWIEYWNELHK